MQTLHLLNTRFQEMLALTKDYLHTQKSSKSGVVIPSAVSTGKESSAGVPVVVLQTSGNSELLTETKGAVKMGILSLATIASAISEAIAVAKAVTPEVKAVYTFAANAMTGVEAAYDGVENAGGTKLAAVMAGAAVVSASVNQDFSAVEADVRAVIAAIKAAFNAATVTTATTAVVVPVAEGTVVAAKADGTSQIITS